MNKILIIEDNLALSERLCMAFMDRETLVTSCSTIGAARDLLQSEQFHVIIREAIVHGENGVAFLQDLKKNSQISVVVLAPNDDQQSIDIIMRMGADDCLMKPFNITALKARVGTQIRKKRLESHLERSRRFEAIGTAFGEDSSERTILINGYVFDFDNMKFSRMGEPVDLSEVEQALLRILVENKGVVLRRNALLSRMKLDTHQELDEFVLDGMVRLLREKLKAADYIKTVYGIGYFWENKVEI